MPEPGIPVPNPAYETGPDSATAKRKGRCARDLDSARDHRWFVASTSSEERSLHSPCRSSNADVAWNTLESAPRHVARRRP